MAGKATRPPTTTTPTAPTTRTRIAVREATAAIRAGRAGDGEDLDPGQAAAVATAVSDHLREVAELLAASVTTTGHPHRHLAGLAVLGAQLHTLAEVAAPTAAHDTDPKTPVAGKHSAAPPAAAPPQPPR